MDHEFLGYQLEGIYVRVRCSCGGDLRIPQRRMTPALLRKRWDEHVASPAAPSGTPDASGGTDAGK